jgi:small subunit ribosomal protein S6
VTESWGRRRLAYPIKSQWEGYYVVQQLRMAPERVLDLERNLKLSEDVMRHLIIRPGV